MSRSIDTVMGAISKRERAYSGTTRSKKQKFTGLYRNVRAQVLSVTTALLPFRTWVAHAISTIETQHIRAHSKNRGYFINNKTPQQGIPRSMEHGECPFVHQEGCRKRDGNARSTESLIASVPSSISISRGNYINGLLGNDLKLIFMRGTRRYSLHCWERTLFWVARSVC